MKRTIIYTHRVTPGFEPRRDLCRIDQKK